MTDKKLTDAEIKRALECCSKAEIYADCEKMKCPLFLGLSRGCKYVDNENQLYSDALDLFTSQQAEIERLRKEVNLVSIQFQDLQERYEEAQANIERLNKENENLLCKLCGKVHRESKVIEKLIKTEAYKEFADKVVHDINSYCENIKTKPSVDGVTGMKIANDLIYKRVNKMEGKNND